jgi:hypothetical protein
MAVLSFRFSCCYVAEQGGHPLYFDKFDPDAFLEAMIVSFGGDEASLASLIEGLVVE